MSLTEIRVKPSEMRIPLGRLLRNLLEHNHHFNRRSSIESQGETPIYNMLRIVIETPHKWLGKGSSGTVYHAMFILSKQRVDCVVKFPNILLQTDCVQINEKTGAITLNPHKRSEAAEYRRQALDEFEIEWHNAFALHYGKKMMHTRIAEPYRSSIQMARLEQAARETETLEHEWGYQNIHELLAMDASIPCLISQHFEMALLQWARSERPDRSTIETRVVPEILAGLRYMHECVDMAHMDVKPNNMLYSRGRRIVISDFGASMPAHTMHHEPAGTIGYMAPEVAAAQNSQKYVPKYADAYSFAVSVMHLIHPEIPCETREEQLRMFDRLQQQESGSNWSYMTQLVPEKRYEMLQSMQQQHKPKIIDRHVGANSAI